ncbi:hypothetical protein ACH436_13325 [Isoptericola sp. NPDC019693]|uniref:hypothetical protein n=1 Tax=Isoptericola sp. NPDC019693 TaxID=3364009 RepID=UPI0037AEA462
MIARRARAGLGAAAVLALLALPAAPALAADDQDGVVPLTVTVPERDGDGGEDGDGDDGGAATLTDAELRWAVNAEAGSGNYVGCNFLMAGTPGTDGDTGGSRIWADGDAGLYHGRAGHVRVLRPVGTGADATQRQATFGTRCTGPTGEKVTLSTTTGAEVVMAGGRGTREADGSVEIAWSGSFTVVFYGGMTYWWASDPVLRLDADGDGTLTATAGGYAADREDVTRWGRLPATKVTLARFDGEKLTGSKGGFLQPAYCGVRVAVGDSSPQVRQDPAGSCWGSFPQSLVDFQQRTGQASYWYSSGHRDAAKPPAVVGVSFDAAESIGSTPPVSGVGTGGGTAAPAGPGSSGGAPSGTGGTTGGAAGPGPGAGGGPGVGTGAAGLATPRAPGAATLADAALTAFPAVQAATLGGGAPALVPDLLRTGDGTGTDRLAVVTTGLLLAASGAVVGFRRRWLVLPFRP